MTTYTCERCGITVPLTAIGEHIEQHIKAAVDLATPTPAMHFNALDPAEAERLAILIEECGEIIQAASKVLRHGYESYNPFDAERTTNRRSLERELGDLDAICGRMVHAGDISREPIRQASVRKAVTLKRWTHHQPDSRT